VTTPQGRCPSCAHDRVRLLEASSREAAVNYYRCDVCAHVWVIAKDGSGRTRHITPPKDSTSPDS